MRNALAIADTGFRTAPAAALALALINAIIIAIIIPA